MAKCDGLLAFEQIGGMLVKGPDGYDYRCMTCGHTGTSKTRPSPGARCKRPASRRDVHTEHCCSKHGCKYNDDDCTVTTGKKPQSRPCETCETETVENTARLADLKAMVKAAEQVIDTSLPKGVKRMGPIELSLTFEPNPGWCVSFAYKLTRRLNSTRFTVVDPALSAEDAIGSLLAKVKLTVENTGKRVENLW